MKKQVLSWKNRSLLFQSSLWESEKKQKEKRRGSDVCKTDVEKISEIACKVFGKKKQEHKLSMGKLRLATTMEHRKEQNNEALL